MNVNFRSLLLLLTLFFIFSPQSKGQTKPIKSQLRTGKLSNGLTYYILHNEKPKNRADFYLVQKVGSVLEEENQRGLAHFLEHMAFNGTKNFPGNTMISALEKKGIKFGYNINAATGYDETIYKLNDIPLTRPGITDTALLVLHDWSGFLTLDEKEIDKERGVVHEEWRTRSSGRMRVLENEILPAMYAGTPYASRLPIGSMDVVDHFKPAQLKEYYKKWYRPDLQAVIVVGDLDAVQVENKLKKLFTDIPTPVNPAKRPYFGIADNEEPVVAIASDPELNEIDLDVYWKLKAEAESQTAGHMLKNKMINAAIGNLMTNRLVALRQKSAWNPGSAIVAIDDFRQISSRKTLKLKLYPPDPSRMLDGLRTDLIEMERLRRFGFTAAELEDYKPGAEREAELDYAGRLEKRNDQYVGELIKSFLEGAPLPDADWKYATEKKILAELNLDTLNQRVQEMITDRNMVFALSWPEKKGAKIPTKAEMLETWAAAKATKLKPYAYQKREAYTLPVVTTKPGKVVKAVQRPFGFVQWTLSNGVRVQYRQVAGATDGYTLYGYGTGGMSAMKLEDLPSAKAMKGSLTLQQDISDPGRKAKVHLFVGEHDQTIAGTAVSSGDVDNLLKMTYLKMTTFKKDSLAFQKLITDYQQAIRNRTLVPKDIFGDMLVSIMTGNDPRKKISLLDSITLKKANYDRMVALFGARFGNAADFLFVITGVMPADSIRPLVETYLGALPSLGKPSKITFPASKEPSGVIKKRLTVAMKTPQTTVTIGYLGDVAMSMKNRILMQCLTGTLKMIYNQKMREEEGGTYGVGVSGDIRKIPKERFLFQVNFDTDPAKKDKLLGIVYRELEKIQQTGPSPEYLNKVKENLLKNHQQENSEKNAGWWATQAYMLEVFGVDGRLDYEKMVNSVNPAKVAEFAKRLLNQGNLIEVVMDPKDTSVK